MWRSHRSASEGSCRFDLHVSGDGLPLATTFGCTQTDAIQIDEIQTNDVRLEEHRSPIRDNQPREGP
jgi:hypothetical protein